MSNIPVLQQISITASLSNSVAGIAGTVQLQPNSSDTAGQLTVNLTSPPALDAAGLACDVADFSFANPLQTGITAVLLTPGDAFTARYRVFPGNLSVNGFSIFMIGADANPQSLPLNQDLTWNYYVVGS